jgi:transposase
MAPHIITLQSPDLNRIEHLWDDLDRHVRSRQPAPQTLQELPQALEQEWGRIPQDRIRRLIEYFQYHFKYRNKHYITLKFGTLVVETLKFIEMANFITLKYIAFR